ncbi:hypothetical protein ACFLYH_02185 [Candidatus Dependentiae bacterium]
MILKYEDEIVTIIHKHLPGSKIYLFNLEYKKEEEADIAIDFGSTINPAIMGNIYSDIKKELFPIIFHIIDLNNATNNYREKILNQGAVLHLGNL